MLEKDKKNRIPYYPSHLSNSGREMGAVSTRVSASTASTEGVSCVNGTIIYYKPLTARESATIEKIKNNATKSLVG